MQPLKIQTAVYNSETSLWFLSTSSLDIHLISQHANFPWSSPLPLHVSPVF